MQDEKKPGTRQSPGCMVWVNLLGIQLTSRSPGTLRQRGRIKTPIASWRSVCGGIDNAVHDVALSSVVKNVRMNAMDVM